MNSFILIFFCQLILSSSSKFDNRALSIVKSIDNYLCQNYIFTCFFRQRYYQLFDEQQQQLNNCKLFFILHSCLHYDINSIHVCHQSILNQTKKYLSNEISTYCYTSYVQKTLSSQHLHSIALPRTIINMEIFVFFFILYFCLASLV